jgi:hypothetical protein
MTGSSSEIPAPLPDDDDDVSWALNTAKVQWKRGELVDAVQWLRRAVDSAREIGNDGRAAELEQAADELAERVLSRAAPSAPPNTNQSQTDPPPSVRAILDSIHETLEEAASQGLVPEPLDASTPLTPSVLPHGEEDQPSESLAQRKPATSKRHDPG